MAGVLWTLKYTQRSYKMWGIFWPGKETLASRKERFHGIGYLTLFSPLYLHYSVSVYGLHSPAKTTHSWSLVKSRIMNRKVCGLKRQWLTLRKGLRKTTKTSVMIHGLRTETRTRDLSGKKEACQSPCRDFGISKVKIPIMCHVCRDIPDNWVRRA